MTLVLLAHGSRHPAGQRVVEAVAARTRLRLPGVEVRTAYAEVCRPTMRSVLAEAPQDAVVLALPCAMDVSLPAPPDFLGTTGISGEVPVGDPLGPDRLLADVLRLRLRAAGARPGQPVVLVTAGSHLWNGSGTAVRAAQMLEEIWRGPVRAASLTGRGQRISEVVAEFARQDAALPALAPYLVAPGPLQGKAREAARLLGLEQVAEVLGDHPHVAESIARRYRATRAHRFALSLA